MGVLHEIANFPRDIAKSLRMNKTQALVFFTSWWLWTLASAHFYFLPYTQPALAKALNVSTSKIAYANTTSMLSRSIGAAILGIMSDQYGAKIPLCVDLVLMAACTLGSGFVNTYHQLIAVRFLFGMTYGALYGANMAAVLGAVPRHARGTVAGFTQQGFGAGNMIASGLHLAMNKYGWRALYYLGAGLTVTAIALRAICPEYSIVDPSHNQDGHLVLEGRRLPFWTKFRYAVTHHWSIFIYCTVLTACFNTLGHGHLDVYPSFLEQQRGLDAKHETWVTIILQTGGVIGGITGGYLSRYSTKWVPFCFALALAPILPAIILPTRWSSLSAAAFFFEFCYGAAIGNVGNILQMVCPHPGIRSAFGGVTYNLGNAISSIAPTIETKLGDDWVTSSGKPNYGKIILILAGVVIGLLSLTLACMPIKNVNANWDLEDPNQVIPAHEMHEVKGHTREDDIEPARDIEEHAPAKRDDGVRAEHLELSQNGA